MGDYTDGVCLIALIASAHRYINFNWFSHRLCVICSDFGFYFLFFWFLCIFLSFTFSLSFIFQIIYFQHQQQQHTPRRWWPRWPPSPQDCAHSCDAGETSALTRRSTPLQHRHHHPLHSLPPHQLHLVSFFLRMRVQEIAWRVRIVGMRKAMCRW